MAEGVADLISLDRWTNTWQALGAAHVDEQLHARILDAYREPHRKYHNLQHLQECFQHLLVLGEQADHAQEIELALWFHDAIYETHRKGSEQKSADWARKEILDAGLDPSIAERVHGLIMVTLHTAAAEGADAQIMIDVDLGILGAETSRFDEYEQQVRAEYKWVPGMLYRRERRKILRSFLDRPTIYCTESFRERYEQRARANISRALSRL